ncbi:hemoblobin-interacting domain-containing protein [Clostridium perfringens]|uniref:hemoblobin-interacting domain-containing protein n=1 Tax=Clostridium perfringens TaxID=1502 RepID=UPI000F5304E0|nr:hemoblobin-interacting domain-containing protein [Clostridium perfringens]
MNKKKLSILTAIIAISACSISKTASAAPSKILTFTNMPVWDYHQRNYDKHGNLRISTAKTTFNLNNEEEKASYIPMFKVDEAELNSPINIQCELKTDEQKDWFEKINKVTLEDATKNPNLERNLEFEKSGNKIIIKGNQKALDNNKLHTIKIYSEGKDWASISVNIVQAEPIKVLVSYPMNPRTGEDVRFKLDNFNYAILNPVNRVFLTHNNVRKELVKFKDYHVISEYLTVYAENVDNEEGNLLEPGKYTLEIYADGFKKAEKDFEVIKNEVIASEKNNSKDNIKIKPVTSKITNKEIKPSSVDTLSSASVGSSKGADNSGSEETSGASIIMQTNLIYNHDLLANALILNELGLGTEESEGIAKRFELNTISWDAVMNEDGTHINDFRDYLNAVKDAALKGDYLTYDEYLKNENSKEYKNRPYNVKEVLEDNLLGDAQNFRTVLGLETPSLEVKSAVMDKDLILESSDTNYLKNIKSITINGGIKELDKSLYSIKDNQLIINSKVVKGDKIKISISSTGYKDKVIETKLEKILDDISLKLEKEYKTGEDVIVTGLSEDFIKNINSIKLDEKLLLTKEQGGSSGNTYYEISKNKLTLKSGLFKEDKNYKLEIDSKYYGKKELEFNITKGDQKENANIEEKSEVEKEIDFTNNISISKESILIKKYNIKFLNSEEWLKNITDISVNEVPYKSGLSWWESKERYAIYEADKTLAIGYESFNNEGENLIKIKSKGYKEYAFIIKYGKITLVQDEKKVESEDTNKEAIKNEENKKGETKEEIKEKEEAQKGEKKESSINKDEAKEKENGKVENKDGNKEEAKEVGEKVEVKEEDSKKEAEKQDVEKENKEVEENKQNAEKNFSGNIPTITKNFFGDKYDLKFLGEDEWLKNVESVYVNDVEYEKKPLIWGDSAGRYNILESDSTISIGIGNFNKDENIIKIKSKGYKECTFIIKDGKISLVK